MKLKVLLCQPVPSEESPQKNPPLGIMYSGAAAEKLGYEVEYWDERWDSHRQLSDAIEKADVVGVSSFTGIQLKYARRILKLAKARGRITLFGGIHANLTSDQCLRDELIDFVAVGEGEVTLPSLLRYLEDGIPPLGIKGEGVNYQVAPQLQGRDLISPITPKTLRFFHLANETNDIMLPSSRGCPYRCGFCVNSTMGSRYRVVDVEVWMSWLSELCSKMKVNWLQVGDDYLGSQKRILAVGEVLHKLGIGWNPSFRADNFNKDGYAFARELKRLGVTDVSIGVETGSERLMKLIDKMETKDDFRHAAKCLSAAGIKPRYYFIVGFPTETRAEMLETLDFADELRAIHDGNCHGPIYNFTPFPGIALYDLAVREGMRIPSRLEEWETFTICNSGTAEQKNIYWIAGLHFHSGKGSKTDINFPGVRRLFIKPFEMLCAFRWKNRLFKGFALEKAGIEFVMKHLKRS